MNESNSGCCTGNPQAVEANKGGIKTVVIAFDPDPQELTCQNYPPFGNPSGKIAEFHVATVIPLPAPTATKYSQVIDLRAKLILDSVPIESPTYTLSKLTADPSDYNYRTQTKISKFIPNGSTLKVVINATIRTDELSKSSEVTVSCP